MTINHRITPNTNMPIKHSIFLIVLFFLFIGLGYIVFNYYMPQTLKGEIHIAFVGSLTGKNLSSGQSMRNAAQLRVDEINQQGGIQGKRLVLDQYDDKSSIEGALEVAQQINQDNRAVSVIGHIRSAQSLAANAHYQQYKIPIITPSATDVEITRGHAWSFRSVFDNRLEGRFMANYAHKVLGFNELSIIYENQSYGPYLAKIIQRHAKQLGMTVPFMRSFSVTSNNLDFDLKQLVKDFKSGGHQGALLLISHAQEGILLVEALKNAHIPNTLMGSHAFASNLFQQGFNGFDKELETPGFYTSNLYVTTPMLFDNAGQKAQKFRMNFVHAFGKEPDWQDAFTYDAVDLISHALTRTHATAIKQQRADIRNTLSRMSKPHLGIQGVTGLNYFDRHGNLFKPIVIGLYLHNQLISALTQLTSLSHPSEIIDIQKAQTSGKITQVSHQYFFKTNIIYTGIQIHEITKLDLIKQTCDISFDLWFRYQGELNPSDIRFLNARNPIQLSSPLQTQQQDGQNYVRYRVEGTFKTDYVAQTHFDEPLISINLAHKNMNTQNLTFVKDIIGMPLAETLTQQKEQILKPSTGWKITKSRFYSNALYQPTQGDLRYLALADNTLHYSRFNVVISLHKRDFSIIDVLPLGIAQILLFITSAILFIRVFFRQIIHINRKIQGIFWFINAIIVILFLWSLEKNLLGNILYNANFDQLIIFQTGFNILWWLIPAWLLISALRCFVWAEIEQKSQRAIPRIVPRFVGFLIILLATLGILAFVFDQKITSLLAASGMLAMIIGLAIKINISNVFAGLAINIERPFRVGDWIRINNEVEGQVTQITWRTTRISTRDKCSVSVPNTEASESIVRNFNYPNNVYKSQLTIPIDGDQHPQRVKHVLLNAVQCVTDILDSPIPTCKIQSLHNLSASYSLSYYANDFAKKSTIEGEVWDKVWHHLYQANLLPTIDTLNTTRQDISSPIETKLAANILAPSPNSYRLLTGIYLFNQGFSPKDLQHLANSLTYRWYDENDIIITLGDKGDSLFIIAEGLVGVWVQTNKGEKMISRLGTTEVIGEMALLTGETRTATIRAITRTRMCEITRQQIAPFLHKEPELGYKLSRILAKRQLATDQLKADNQQEFNELSESFMSKIQHLFKLKNKY